MLNSIDPKCQDCGRKMTHMDYVIHHTCFKCSGSESMEEENRPTLYKPRRVSKKERTTLILVDESGKETYRTTV